MSPSLVAAVYGSPEVAQIVTATSIVYDADGMQKFFCSVSRSTPVEEF